MTFYHCVVLVPPEGFDEAEARLADVEWSRTNQDRERGFIELAGAFDSAETALSQLFQAFPNLEPPAVFRVEELGRESIRLEDVTQVRALLASDISDGVFGMANGLLGSVGTGEPPKAVVVPIGSSSQAEDGTSGAGANAKKDEPSPTETPKAPEPQVAPMAQTIEAGLKAIKVPPELWKGLPPTAAKQELARRLLERFYGERSDYARNVRWTFAPDAELLSQAPNEETRSTLAVDAFRARAGLLQHQLDSATQDVELKKQSVAYAAQGVELRKKAVAQHGVVTDMLEEFLAHLKRWRALSVLAAFLLVVTLIFSMIIMVWLVKLTRDAKLSDWGLPAAIFALALFVISPAVLLLRERPLKGLDEAGWPGAPSKPEEEQSAGSGGGAPTPAPPAAPATPASPPTNPP